MIFNGHRSYAAYDVYTTLTNDENLYWACVDEIQSAKGNCARASVKMLSWLPTKTPSGSKFTKTSIKETLVEIKESLCQK